MHGCEKLSFKPFPYKDIFKEETPVILEKKEESDNKSINFVF